MLAVEPLAKGLAVDHRHGEPERPVDGAGVEQRDDVRVRELGRDGDLAKEPVGANTAGDLGVHRLDRDIAVVARVVRQIHGRHAAAAELANDAVAVGDVGGRALVGAALAHDCSGPGR